MNVLSTDVVYSGLRSKSGKCQISRRDPDGSITRINLADSLKVRRKSPTGFEWGYAGSGPAQTAIALLLDFTGDPELANQLFQDFKFLIVGSLAEKRWDLTGHEIADAIAQIRAEREKKQCP